MEMTFDSVRRRTFLVGAGSAVAAAASGLRIDPAFAQAYPTRGVNVVVPFPPGGYADILARPLSASLEAHFKQPFTVVNRPGAAGTVGMQSVTTARPDGYTMLLALQSISTLSAVDELFGRAPTFRREQFKGIARLTGDPCIMFVGTDVPWKTFRDFVDDARKRPDQIIYSSSGLYGATHIPSEMLMRVTGTKLKHLPTTGGAPAINAVLGGHAHFFFTVAALGTPHEKAGKFRALAVSSAKRLSTYPDLPTLKELGFDLEFYNWSGLFVPAATPDSIVESIRKGVYTAAHGKEFREALVKLNTEFAYLDGKEFVTWWDEESKMLADEVRKIGKIEK
jgi:tripartite-type tricarboxylate transporter receptor subunit TctC